MSQSYCSPITSSCRRHRLALAEVREHLIYHIKLLSPRDTRCKRKWDGSRESSLHPGTRSERDELSLKSSRLFLSFSVILSWMAPNSSPLSFGRSSHIDVCVPQLLANFSATLIGVEDLVALEIQNTRDHIELVLSLLLGCSCSCCGCLCGGGCDVFRTALLCSHFAEPERTFCF